MKLYGTMDNIAYDDMIKSYEKNKEIRHLDIDGIVFFATFKEAVDNLFDDMEKTMYTSGSVFSVIEFDFSNDLMASITTSAFMGNTVDIGYGELTLRIMVDIKVP
jgi:hypothetical protein